MARARKTAPAGSDGKRKIEQYDPHLDPTLTWAGKAEYTSFPARGNRPRAHRGLSGYGVSPVRGGVHKRVAVKIVDDRGIESLKVNPVK